MERLYVYRTDPLARLLIGRLRLTPLSLALIMGTLMFGIQALVAQATGQLLSAPDHVGFLQDPGSLIYTLFFNPVLAGFYLWGANAISDLLSHLQRSEVVDISDEDAAIVERMYGRPWRLLLALTVAPVVGAIYAVARSDVKGWAGNTLASRVVTIAGFTAGTYAGTMLIMALLLNVLILRQIFRGKELRVHPLHPDRCGGLRPLSTYSLKTAYLVAIFGLMLGMTEYRYITTGIIGKYWVLQLAIPAYVVGSAIAFFAPISTAHAGMARAKERLLHDIACQFQADYLAARSTLGGSPGGLKDGIDKIEELQTLYDVTTHFPVWPFDVQTLRRFAASIAAPFIPPIIGLAIDQLAKLVFRP